MEWPFEKNCASLESQLLGRPVSVADSPAVMQARQRCDTAGDLVALGQALSRQLRYREAIDVYSAALALEPDNCRILRLRAGSYLSTLQASAALRDFHRCLELGGEKQDCLYRMGLAQYYAGNYAYASSFLEDCFPLCDEEMGIAVIYWHTLTQVRRGTPPTLLKAYHPGMKVGHHTAYEKAVAVWAGVKDFDELLEELESQRDDLEYGIALYGLIFHPICQKREEYLSRLLCRDGFWFSFAYLAAWIDRSSGYAL